MPCNSVAMVRARVNNATIVRLLTGERVAPVLQTYLSSQGLLDVTVGAVNPTGCLLYCGTGYVQFQDGELTLRGTPALRAGLLETLRQLLTLLGGQLLQQEVRALLMQQGALVDEQSAPGGALILRLEI